MPRYKYISPFQNWYQYDCNWWPETWDLKEARTNAEAKHPNATIGVHADCLINDLPDVAKVLIYVKDTVGKTDEEVCELLDLKIDAFIAFRDERSPVCRIPEAFWTNYEKRTGKKVQMPPY